MNKTLKVITIILLISQINGCASQKKEPLSDVDDQISISVNPTIELFSLMHHYAGDKQYTENLLPEYLEELENYFGHLKDHQAIIFVKECKSKYQINGDAPMSLAVYIDPPPALEPRLDLSNLPVSFDPRWDSALISDYLKNARDFAIESNFMDFNNDHKDLHELSVFNLKKLMNEEDIFQWYRDFFGYFPDNFNIYIALLNGSCNYGYPLTFPDGEMEFVSLLGARWPDKKGAPTYGEDWFLPVIIHEFCHSYINPLTISRPEEFMDLGEALLVTHRKEMIEHGYNVWNVILNEYMVRACTIRFLEQTEGKGKGRENIKRDLQSGFTEIKGLVSLLDEYEDERTTYPDIESFLPRVKTYFESYLEETHGEY